MTCSISRVPRVVGRPGAEDRHGQAKPFVEDGIKTTDLGSRRNAAGLSDEGAGSRSGPDQVQTIAGTGWGVAGPRRSEQIVSRPAQDCLVEVRNIGSGTDVVSGHEILPVGGHGSPR